MKVQITTQYKGESRLKPRSLGRLTKAEKAEIICHLKGIKQLLRNEMQGVHTAQVIFTNEEQEEVMTCTL